MADSLPVYMGSVPDYEVRDGQMHIIVSSFEIVMPLRVFQVGAAKAERAIAKWSTEERGKVIPMRRRKAASHAAT